VEPIFDDYGDWRIVTTPSAVEFMGCGVVLHKHSDVLYFTVRGRTCRECGEIVPPGIKIKAMLERV